MSTTYSYSVQNHFSGAINVSRLRKEIKAELNIDYAGKFDKINRNADDVHIVFNLALTGSEQTYLNAVVAAHNGLLRESSLQLTSAGLSETRTVLKSTQTVDREIVLPDIDGYLLTTSSVDTLSNKSIDASANTLTNIGNDEIKPAAGIAATKIANGSVSSAEYERLSGVTSNIQTQIDSKTATGHTHVAANISDFDTEVGNHVDVSANSAHRVNTSNPHSVTKTQVGLGNVANTKVNLNASVAPVAADDNGSGYTVGSVWVNTSADRAYVCVDASTAAAVWRQIGIESHTDLAAVGSNTHAQIDTHIADSSKHCIINDSGTSSTELWSASKISTQLATKSSAEHTHVAANITDFGAAADARIAAQKAQANGLATLDAGGKVPASQLNLDSVVYQGAWNASTNTPTITGATGTKGHYYVVSVSGTTSIDGETDWVVGDWIIYNGVSWEKADHTSAVTSVAGKQGAVTLQAGDITDFDTEVGNNSFVVVNTAHRSNTSNPHSVTKEQVGLSNVANLKTNLSAIAAPSATDDSTAGYAVGSLWIDTAAGRAYACVDASASAALWRQIGIESHGQLTDIGTNTHAQIDTHLADDTKHRIINDGGTGATQLWSASKISSELSGKANASHVHAAADVTSGTFAAARIGASSVTQHEAAINHQNLSGAGNNTHAQIDNHIADASKHRSINDAGIAITDLWSASKISGELSGKAAASHTHAASDITSGTFANSLVAQTNVTQHQAAISHDALSGFVSSEHINHDSVSITAGTGLNGGGTIAQTRTINLALDALTTDTAVDRDADYLPFYDASLGAQRKVLVKNLKPYNGSAVGDVLVYDGTTYVRLPLGANGNLLQVDTLQATKLAWSDTVPQHNHGASEITTGTLANALVTASNVTQHVASIDHNLLLNYDANKHIDHASVSIMVGSGLSGGGTIAATRTIYLDINGLVADATPDGAADYLLTYDTSAGTHKKVLIDNLPIGGSGDVTGPVSSLDKEIAVFSGTGGKTLTGCGRRDYGVSATDPTNPAPQDGDRYYNSAIQHEMCYDATRSKWLSVAVLTDGGGRNGTTTAGTYYRRFNGMGMNALQGPHHPKGTIIRIGYATSVGVSHVYEVCLDGTPIAELASGGAAVVYSDFDADFDAGVLTSRNKSGSATTTNFQSTIHYKLRA